MFDYKYFGRNRLSIHQNMALEEYTLNESALHNIATIRFWEVDRDSAVIGYGESKSNIIKEDKSFDLARRITGGSHVQFDRNCLAYSFTVPRDGSFKHFEDMRKFFAEKVTNALIGLGINGAEADNRASTINVDRKVMASHAIFWGVESALLHGLILVDHYDVDSIIERMLLKERKIGRHTYAEYDALKGMPVAKELINSVPFGIDEDKRLGYVKSMICKSILSEVAEGRYKVEGIDDYAINNAMKLAEARHVGRPWVEKRYPTYGKEEVEAIPGEELDGGLKKDLGYCMYIEVPDKDFSKMALPKEELRE